MRKLLVLVGLAVTTTATGQEPTAPEARAWDDNFNPQVSEYDVVKGDTLWDISARVVGDPYLWPKVWSLNPEITNPHWIYPGDRIRFFPPTLELPSQEELISGSMGMPEYLDPDAQPHDVEEIVSGQPTQESDKSSVIEIIDEQPRRAFRAGPLYRYLERFVTPKELQEAGVLTNAVPDTVLLSAGDQVYLRFASSKRPEPGKKLLAYRTTNEVFHPEDGDHRGYLTQITGVLTVVASPKTEEVTRARIVQSFYEIERGNHITPVEQDLLIRLARVPTDKRVTGTIMAVRQGIEQVVGDNELVYIDKGKSHGLVRGNQLRVMDSGDKLTGDNDGKLTRAIGLLQVVDARDTASTCLVVNARREFGPGAKVETVVDKTAAAAPTADTG